MEIAHNSSQLRQKIHAFRQNGETVALVPTMGALHEGHMSLVELAHSKADRVVVSIFVNPKQFGPNEDFNRYPRQHEADAALLTQHGADILFLPSVEDIYPNGYATTVRVSGLDEPMEGSSRPGHFDGVATIVAKLLLMALPDVAIFGEKDWQQLAIIRRMATDLNIPTTILGAPILRAEDGLALSSRNAYLSPADRAAASVLPATMADAARALATGADPATILAAATARLTQVGFAVDYLVQADAEHLGAAEKGRPSRLFVAAKIGTTRLIDNWPI